jgi:ATP-dependent protease HslVU (ClpYQ) peptidase subunit
MVARARGAAPVRGRARQVRAVVAGLVLVCFNGSSAHLPHVAFRLSSLKVEAEFTCRGAARPYLFE